MQSPYAELILDFDSSQKSINHCRDFASAVEAVRKHDFLSAFKIWLELAQDGVKEAEYNVGFLIETRSEIPGRLEDAVEWYSRAAKNGLVEAMAAMGAICAEPPSGMCNPLEAISWYRRAADAGSMGAMNVLGSWYEEGNPVAQDFAKAAYWYTRAAASGSSEGQILLSHLYESGYGVPKDEVAAFALLDAASKSLHKTYRETASQNAAKLIEIMSDDQIKMAYNPAVLEEIYAQVE
jgi:TPR repeat protein